MELIQTFTLPIGSSTLHKTRRMSSPNSFARRAEETGAFNLEILSNNPDPTVYPLDTDRGITALSKLNWIHEKYKHAIPNDLMLHTLSLNITCPIDFIERFEWRPLCELERVALFTYWAEVGRRMGIKDIPGTLDELRLFAKDYEDKHEVFRGYPACLRQTGEDFVAALCLEERKRVALGMREPPAWVRFVVEAGFVLKAFVVRTLLLPRFRPLVIAPVQDPQAKRIREVGYALEPWFVGEDWMSRILRMVGVTKWMGMPLPGKEFRSEGFLSEELGPEVWREKCKEDVKEQAGRMGEYARLKDGRGGGCPFAI